MLVCSLFSVAPLFTPPRCQLDKSVHYRDDLSRRNDRIMPSMTRPRPGQNVRNDKMPGPTGLGLGSFVNQSTSNKGLVPTTTMVSPIHTRAVTLNLRGDDSSLIRGWVC